MARILCLIIAVSVTVADVAGFTCVCNRDTQQNFDIFNSTHADVVIGYLNPNECKPFLNRLDTEGLFEIQFNNETGYVMEDDNIVMANCSGASPDLAGNLTLCPSYVVQGAKSNDYVLTQHNHRCYELCSERISWSHASQLCTERGGHLLTIHSAAENKYVHSVLLKLNYKHRVWIGLHDRDNEGHFKWTTGEKVSYTHWGHGQPESMHHHHNTQDCVVFLSSGEWNDVQCGGDDPSSEASDSKASYICEYNIHNSGSYIIG